MNVQRIISCVKTADGLLNEIHNDPLAKYKDTFTDDQWTVLRSLLIKVLVMLPLEYREYGE